MYMHVYVALLYHNNEHQICIFVILSPREYSMQFPQPSPIAASLSLILLKSHLKINLDLLYYFLHYIYTAISCIKPYHYVPLGKYTRIYR